MQTAENLQIDILIATNNDIHELAILAQSWAAEMEYKVQLEEIEEDLKRMVSTGVVIFSRQCGEIVGMMSGFITYHYWVHEKTAHEHWFFVRPDKRNLGIGDILLDAFMAWAKSMQCNSVIVSPNKFGSLRPEILAKYLFKKGYDFHGFQMRRIF